MKFRRRGKIVWVSLGLFLLIPSMLCGQAIAVDFGTYPGSSYEFVTKWGTEGYNDGQFKFPNAIAVDSSGYVYVLDHSEQRVQKFTSDGTFVSKLKYGDFWGAKGIAVDDDGNIYICDTENNRIQKFAPNGALLTRWGTEGYNDGQFKFPNAIAVDSSGYVYVLDHSEQRVQKFTSDGTFVSKLKYGDFWGAKGIAVDDDGNIYICDTENNRIQKFAPNGALLTRWGTEGYNDGQFKFPNAIAVDSSGYVYVLDHSEQRVQKFTSDGTFVSKLKYGDFWGAKGIAVDDGGNIYICDTENNRIQVFKPINGVNPQQLDTGFILGKHGYQFYNFDKSPLSWNLFEAVYGKDEVTYSNGNPTITANAFYSLNFKNSATGGSCFGISASSLDLFQNSQDGEYAWNTGIAETLNLDRSWSFFANEKIPTSLSTVEDFIEYYHPQQMDRACQNDRDYYQGSITVYNELKSRMGNKNAWIADPVVLDIWWIDGQDLHGHTIVPYKIIEDNNVAKVYVYDSNYPLKDYADYEFWVEFDQNTNSLQTGYDYYFNGQKYEFSLINIDVVTLVRLSTIKQDSDIPFWDSVSSMIRLFFTSSDGDHLGYYNGEWVSEIPGAYKVTITGDSSQYPETYYIGDLDLKREIVGTDYGVGSVSIIRPNTLVTANISVTPISVDELVVPPDGSYAEFISGQGTDSLELNFVKETDEFGRMAAINGFSLKTGDAAGLAFEEDLQNITLTNTGTEREYTLILEQVGSNAGTFENPFLTTLGPDSSAKIIPDNWDDLENTYLKVEHDIGNDGIIDETEIATELVATVDLDPDVIKLGSKGNVVTAYIELPPEYGADDFGEGPVRLVTVNGQYVDLPAIEPNTVGDYDEDAIPDLMVKFDRQILEEFLTEGENEISVLGTLSDGMYYSGVDAIRAK
ncbi:NHL repeat-containing protein [Methanovulcanius yangii]|uniref:hypothetical protein n=1 Tax=Methanovulcanius yangii TaxID=1789227 RepID=UPI0029CA22B2|nr:hypothetical protein [Methanovulcanius yangii]